MIDLGHFALVTAWILSVYGLFGGLWGAHRRQEATCVSVRRALYVVFGLTFIAIGALAVAFLQHDYRYLYVWRHSNNAMAPLYLISAIWGGMDGSMLLWAFIMLIFCCLAVRKTVVIAPGLVNWAVPIMHGATCFFLFVVTFLTNPFRIVPPDRVLPDGNGLNPLLQNPSMMIHPPCLYAGFTGFVVPFAFCIGALLSGQISSYSWIQLTRRWSLVAWSFLTVGIILGGNWAYIELGWGGFWAWDPVENASFLPWLSGTAFIHSVMVQERRGLLKIWNVSLAVLTYALTVFGTFLTRSGIVQSVHAFADSDVGWVFLVYLAIIIATTVALIIYRRRELRPDNGFDSFLSREALFLFNNLLFLSICFATFWGVMLPVFSEAFGAEKAVVGPPFYNQVGGPLFLALLLLMGIGPLFAWRKSNVRSVFRIAAVPFLFGLIVTGFFLWADRYLWAGEGSAKASITFGLSVFVLGAISAEYRRAIQIQRALREDSPSSAMARLVSRKPRRYGGLLVHFGVAISAIAIAASSIYKIERDVVLKTGEQHSIGRYTLGLTSLEETQSENYGALVAKVSVLDRQTGELIKTMKPERRFYFRSQETTTEVDIRITPREDLYVALAGLDVGAAGDAKNVDLQSVSAIFKVFVNPLQMWLWVGSIIILIGAIVVTVPAFQEMNQLVGVYERSSADRRSEQLEKAVV